MKKFLTSFITISLLIGLTSCGPKAPNVFTVTYETEFGTKPEAISVDEGTVLTAEQLPDLIDANNTFLGWFDGETEAKADEYTVTKDATLTAKWEAIPLWKGSKSIGWDEPDQLRINDLKDKVGNNNALKITYTTKANKPIVRFMDMTNWKNNFPEYSEGNCELIRKIDDGAEINDIDLPVNKETGVVTLAFSKDQMATLAEKGVAIMGQDFTITKIEVAKVSYTLAPDVILWEGEDTIKYEDNIVIPAGKIPADAKGLRIYVKSCVKYSSSICFDYPDWQNRPHMSSITGNADDYNKGEMAILNVENGPAIVNCYFTSDVMTSFSSQAIGVHGDANANTVITKITLIK